MVSVRPRYQRAGSNWQAIKRLEGEAIAAGRHEPRAEPSPANNGSAGASPSRYSTRLFQNLPLPLGEGRGEGFWNSRLIFASTQERVMGLEPTTATLARWRSTN